MSKALKNKVKLNDWVSVKDFGAVGDGVTDDSVAFNTAFATGKKVYIPSGTYAVNATSALKLTMLGDGSNATFIKPFNTATAAITYTATSPYWTYHSEVKGICFLGTSKTGIGFTFGGSDPTTRPANGEYANNVRFVGCRFRQLDKGVQFAFGNIGSSFYDCGFSGNRYGVYSVNNKSGTGDGMHAGNKYFYSGEFSENDCGVYIHNRQDGFGGVSFTDTIFEYNQLAGYFDTTSCFTPISFRNVWQEGNGTTAGGSGTVTIDQWVGSVKSTQNVPLKTFVFAGSMLSATFHEGFVTDILVSAATSNIDVYNARVETRVGVSGGSFSVTGSESQIRLHNPTSNGGIGYANGCVVVGSIQSQNNTVDGVSANAITRGFATQHRNTILKGHGSSGVSDKLTQAAGYGAGSFSGTGTVVSDGVLYPVCNEFTIPFTSTSEYVALLSSVLTSTAGWYVMTVDVKYVSGANVNLFVWDRSTVQAMTNLVATGTGRWRTFAGVFYSPGAQTWYLDFGNVNASSTFRLSAFQCRRFDSQEEARAFLESRAYVEQRYTGNATYDPPNLADGAGVTTTVTATGAALGDFVESVSFSLDLQGISLTAWVSAANTVSVRFQNESGGALDLGSGTLRVAVVKP